MRRAHLERARHARLSPAARRRGSAESCSSSIARAWPRMASRRAFAAASPASSRARTSSTASRCRRRTSCPAKSYAVDDVALASKLSFFLWNTIPDDELRDLAVRGELGDERVLRAPGRANAEGSARRDARQQLRLPLARSEAPRGGRARHVDLPVCVRPRRSARGLPHRDRAVREEHLRRGSQRRGLHDGEAHVRQRARSRCCTASTASRATVSNAWSSRIRLAGACSARAPS